MLSLIPMQPDAVEIVHRIEVSIISILPLPPFESRSEVAFFFHLDALAIINKADYSKNPVGGHALFTRLRVCRSGRRRGSTMCVAEILAALFRGLLSRDADHLGQPQSSD